MMIPMYEIVLGFPSIINEKDDCDYHDQIALFRSPPATVIPHFFQGLRKFLHVHFPAKPKPYSF